MALTRLYIETERGPGDTIKAAAGSKIFFNPNQYTITKKATWTEAKVQGLGVPVQQFKNGEPRTLAMSLVFDTLEERSDVRKLTGKLAKLVEVTSDGKPSVCKIFWGPDQDNAAALSFQGVIETLTQKFTLFLDDGTPVRATVDLAMKESESPSKQKKRQGPKKGSPIQGRTHVVKTGDTLWAIAAAEYLDPARWRPIARANGIVDPRRLEPGTILLIPPLEA